MSSDDVNIDVVSDMDVAWPELESLYLAIARYHEPMTGERLLPGWQEIQRAALAVGGERFIAIARERGRAVGFIEGVIRRDPGLFGTDLGFVNTAYVDAERRRRGIGRRLLAVFEEWCRAHDVTRIDLSVRAANVAGIAAWRALGFEDESLRLTKHIASPDSDRA